MLAVSLKRRAGTLPALATGLYAGRVLSEAGGVQSAVAVVLTLLTCALALISCRRMNWKFGWPLLLLAGYAFYPDPDPRAAALAAVLAGTLLLQPALARRWQRGPWMPAAMLFLGAAAVYLFTLAPGVLPADGGEFQLVAAVLGVAHPPGFPLYTLLGHLMTRLPLGPGAAYRLNLFSALTSAGTLALVYLSVYRLRQSHLASLAAALALGGATTFWAQATTANIRSLTAFFAALALYALVALTLSAREPGGPRLGPLLLLAASLAFGVTHHPSLAFIGGVWGLAALWLARGRLRSRRLWWRLLLAGGAGLLPLLYLPLRGAAGAWGAPPDLATWPGFWRHVLARGFAGDLFYFLEPAQLWQRLLVMGDVLRFQFQPLLLAGSGLGLAWLLWRERTLGLALAGSFFLHTLVTATYRAPQTVEYMMPAYVPLAVALGVAAALPVRLNRLPALSALLGAVFLLAAMVQALERWPSFAPPAQAGVAARTIEPLLAQAPEGALVLAGWHWATPLWYAQLVEGRRPDLQIAYVAPGAEPYGETWARRIQEGLAHGREVVATHFFAASYAPLPAPEPLAEAFLFRLQPRQTMPASFQPLDLSLGNSLQITGFSLEAESVEIWEESALTVAWRARAPLDPSTTLFAHLVDEQGRLLAQDDVPLAGGSGLNLTRLRLTPRLGTVPGRYRILLGATASQPLPGPGGEERTPLASLTVSAMSRPPVTGHPLRRDLPAVRPLLRLVGYDWDTTLPGQTRLYLHWQTEAGYQTEVRDNVGPEQLALPAAYGPWHWPRPLRLDEAGNQHYVPLGQGVVWTGPGLAELPALAPGRSLVVPLRFWSSRPMARDLVVSLRLVGFESDGFHWAWGVEPSDSVPALGAIPTLKWVAGSRVSDPHTMMVPAEATPGQEAGGLLRLYDAFTQRPVPILDERITALAPWVPLGRVRLRP